MESLCRALKMQGVTGFSERHACSIVQHSSSPAAAEHVRRSNGHGYVCKMRKMRCSNCVASESNKCSLLCGGLFGSKGLGSYSYWQAWQAGPPNRSCKQLSLEQGWHCSADDPIPDKVGVQVRLTKQVRVSAACLVNKHNGCANLARLVNGMEHFCMPFIPPPEEKLALKKLECSMCKAVISREPTTLLVPALNSWLPVIRRGSQSPR